MTQQTGEPQDAAAAKAALRRDVLARRAGLPEALRREAGQALAVSARAIVADAKTVSAFVSIKGEIDTAPLIERLHADGKAVGLPVILAKGHPLVFRRWRPGEPLEEKKFGVLEPSPDAPETVPDLLFVPLAAYDRRGFRLGYGGGFYDRTLARLRAAKKITAIGLAFSAQEVETVPTDPFDQRLDGVLTERGFMRFEGQLS